VYDNDKSGEKSELEELGAANRELSERLEQLHRMMPDNRRQKATSTQQDGPKQERLLAKIELGDVNFSGDADEDPDWWAKQIQDFNT
jgi:hypothetical protein